MTIHFRSDCGDATLRVEDEPGFRRGPCLRVSLPGGRFRTFSLTERERTMLIAELTAPTYDFTSTVCFHGDHVPGCEHDVAEAMGVDWLDVGAAILGIGSLIDPPLEGPPADEEEHLDPLDDPVGHGEPAF